MKDKVGSPNVVMVLVGPDAGRDMKHECGKRWWQFVRGRCPLNMPASECEGMIRYLGRACQAYPEGSPEVAAFERNTHGQHQTEAAAEPGHPDAVQERVRPAGQGPGQGSPEDGGGDDDGGGGEARLPADGSERSGSAPAEGREAPVESSQAQSESKVGQALSMLDHDNDEHWTRDGRPAVSAVASMAGPNLTRAMIEAVAPDFRREVMGGEEQDQDRSTAAVSIQ